MTQALYPGIYQCPCGVLCLLSDHLRAASPAIKRTTAFQHYINTSFDYRQVDKKKDMSGTFFCLNTSIIFLLALFFTSQAIIKSKNLMITTSHQNPFQSALLWKQRHWEDVGSYQMKIIQRTGSCLAPSPPIPLLQHLPLHPTILKCRILFLYKELQRISPISTNSFSLELLPLCTNNPISGCNHYVCNIQYSTVAINRLYSHHALEQKQSMERQLFIKISSVEED